MDSFSLWVRWAQEPCTHHLKSRAMVTLNQLFYSGSDWILQEAKMGNAVAWGENEQGTREESQVRGQGVRPIGSTIANFWSSWILLRESFFFFLCHQMNLKIVLRVAGNGSSVTLGVSLWGPSGVGLGSCQVTLVFSQAPSAHSPRPCPSAGRHTQECPDQLELSGAEILSAAHWRQLLRQV